MGRPLPPSDQADRCRAVQAGLAARAELVESSQGLVIMLAGQYARRTPGVELDDLIQEANLALMDAIRWFRSDRGANFISYAKVAIVNRLVAYLNRPGARPLPQEPDDVRRVGGQLTRALELLPQPPPRLSDDTLDRLDAALSVLTPTEKYIVVKRLGLGGQSPHHYAAIAAEVGLTASATARLYRAAMRRLKKRGRGDPQR